MWEIHPSAKCQHKDYAPSKKTSDFFHQKPQLESFQLHSDSLKSLNFLWNHPLHHYPVRSSVDPALAAQIPPPAKKSCTTYIAFSLPMCKGVQPLQMLSRVCFPRPPTTYLRPLNTWLQLKILSLGSQVVISLLLSLAMWSCLFIIDHFQVSPLVKLDC